MKLPPAPAPGDTAATQSEPTVAPAPQERTTRRARKTLRKPVKRKPAFVTAASRERSKLAAITQEMIEAVAGYSAVPTCIYSRNDYRFLYVNDAMLTRYGYTREEMLGMSIFQIRGPEERLRLTLQMQRLNGGFPGRSGTSGLWRHETKTGEPLWVEILYQVIRFQGEDACLILAPDATDRLEAWNEQNEYLAELTRSEEEARRSAADLTRLLEETPDAFFAVDRDWRFTCVNRNAEALLSQPREALLGEELWDVLSPRHLPLSRHLHKAMRDQRPLRFEQYFPAATSGSSGWFEVHAFPLPADTPGLSLFLRDITARKEAEAERERLDRERMAAVLQQRSFLKEVLYAVTEGRLQLCDSHEELPPTAPCAVGAIIPLLSAAALSEIRGQVRDAAAQCEFSPERTFEIISAVGEAAMNALQHGNPEQPGSVTIRTDLERRLVQVWVRDNGGGIRLDELPRATLLHGHSTKGTLGHGFPIMLRTLDQLFLQTSAAGTTLVLQQYQTQPLPQWLAGFPSPTEKDSPSLSSTP